MSRYTIRVDTRKLLIMAPIHNSSLNTHRENNCPIYELSNSVSRVSKEVISLFFTFTDGRIMLHSTWKLSTETRLAPIAMQDLIHSALTFFLRRPFQSTSQILKNEYYEVTSRKREEYGLFRGKGIKHQHDESWIAMSFLNFQERWKNARRNSALVDMYITGL